MKRTGMMRRLTFALEAAIVIPLGTFASMWPRRAGAAVFSLGGSTAYYFSRRGRRRAFKNLDIVFADKPLARRRKRRIVKDLYKNAGVSLCEYLQTGRITSQNYGRFARVKNLASFHEALSEGRGVLAITAHVGNWELLGTVGARLGLDIGVVIYRQWNPWTDAWLKRIREEKGGVKCFYNEAGHLPGILRHLKGNGILALVADERQSAKAIRVPFFNRLCATASGPAKLHLRRGVPIVFCFSTRQKDGKVLLSADGPYHFPSTGDFERDCEGVMTWINGKYEAVIRQHPEQWFGLTRPRWEGMS